MSRKILIATPANNGMMCSETHDSICYSKDEGYRNGWDVRSFASRTGADLAYARNMILGIFLATPCDDLLMVDADVSWGHGTFERIMSHDVDFVAGLYRERVDYRVHYPVRWPQKRRLEVSPATGLPLLEAEMTPAGFVRVTRKCVEKVAERAEHWVTDECATALGIRIPWVFEWTWHGRERKSEDYTFCVRWREAGGTVWVDPSLKLDHTGPTTFRGDFMAHLEQEVA